MRWLHRIRWAESLSSFLDDELDARRAARFLAHLERCPACLEELEKLVQLQRSLAKLPAHR